jgi:diguanylate cyclase (GGDEF)-like protein
VSELFNADQQSERFHFEMIQKYCTLFQNIETETLSKSTLQQLSTLIMQSPLLSNEEKRVHHILLTQFEKLSEEVKTLHWMSNHLKVLHELGQTFSYAYNKEQIYQKAYELISRVMDAHAFVIAIYHEGEHEIHIPFSIDGGVRYDPRTIPLGQGIISKVIETRQTIHLRTESEVINHENVVVWGNPEQNTETCIFVPMILNNRLVGVLSVQNYSKFAYGEEHEELLRIFGIQVASAIERADLYDKLYEMSVIDELTNIKNSRKFHLDLAEKVASSEEQPITLIMFDSDNLKQVNDRFGHHVGDELIKHVSDALLMHIDDGEEAYRFAGDEFMIISDEADLGKVLAKAGQIQTYLKSKPFIYDNQQITATVSIGIAQYPFDTTNAEDLKRLADKAMYESKRNGKDQITVYKEIEHLFHK